MNQKIKSVLFAFGFAIVVLVYMNVLSLPIGQLILLISDKNITTEEINNLFSFLRKISLILGVVYGFGTMVLSKLRKMALYSISIMIFTLNIIPFLIFCDAINLIVVFTHGNLNYSKYISFMTMNYLPDAYRIAIFCTIVISSIIFDVYCLWQGHQLPYNHITLYSQKLTHEVNFVHISDTHIGSRFVSHSKRIVEKIIPIQPDFVLITGDLTDSPIVQNEELIPFKVLSEYCPVYMSTGNHDYITGIDRLMPMLNNCGIKLLQNEIEVLEKYNCSIIGTDDTNTEKKYINEMDELSKKVLRQTYNIILQHRPHGYQQTCENGKFDLMLAGHTHGGQFTPFSAFVYLFFRKAYGLYDIKSNNNLMYLYTHPGTGAWGAHMRSAGTNDITIFHLKPANLKVN